MTDENMYWSVCPVEEKWDKYARALAERYAKEDGILWEIWNEPDWEFFTGKPEDYLSLLERTAKIFREVNPSVYLYPGGLTVVNEPSDYRYKDSRPYFAGFRRLLDGKLINNYSVHIHGTFGEEYFHGTLEEMTRQAKEAGLSTEGIYNTEAGVFETNEQTQANILCQRSSTPAVTASECTFSIPSAPFRLSRRTAGRYSTVISSRKKLQLLMRCLSANSVSVKKPEPSATSVRCMRISTGTENKVSLRYSERAGR